MPRRPTPPKRLVPLAVPLSLSNLTQLKVVLSLEELKMPPGREMPWAVSNPELLLVALRLAEPKVFLNLEKLKAVVSQAQLRVVLNPAQLKVVLRRHQPLTRSLLMLQVLEKSPWRQVRLLGLRRPLQVLAVSSE